MRTQLIVHPVISAIFWLALAVMAIMIISWYLAEFKAKRWNNDYLLLQSLIYDSDVNKESYDCICQDFDNMNYNNEAEHKMMRSLWTDFQIKFKELSHYNIEEDSIESRLAEIKNY
jgi:hypothetical protein